MQRWETPRLLYYNWTEQYRSAVRPVGHACLTSFNFEVFWGQMNHKRKIYVTRGHRFMCRCQIWWRWAAGKLTKCHLVWRSYPGLDRTPILPPLGRLRPKFYEHCAPWPVPGYQIWSGLVAVSWVVSVRLIFRTQSHYNGWKPVWLSVHMTMTVNLWVLSHCSWHTTSTTSVFLRDACTTEHVVVTRRLSLK